MARRRYRKTGPRRKTNIGIMSTSALTAGLANIAVGQEYNIPYEVGEAFAGRQTWGEAGSKSLKAIQTGAPSMVTALVPVVVGRLIMRAFGIPNPTVMTTKRLNIRLV